MKSLITTVLSLLCVGILNSCQSDDTFCIDNVTFKGTAQSAEHTITLPNGETFSGAGALPFDVSIGNYSGKMSSVVLSQVPGPNGLEVELIHFFDDSKGNTFWTSDRAIMIPTDDPSGAVMSVDDTMTVVDGTGDFKCASGTIKNIGTIDFIAFTLEVELSGSVCGGCE